MEFLQILLLITSAYFIWRRPEKQVAAERLLYGAAFIMLFVWFVATKHMILPPGNY